MERVEAELHGWPQAPYPRRRRWTPTTSACSSTAAGPTTRAGGASRRRQPQPLRRRVGPGAARGARRRRPGSSSRCSRAWPTTRRGRCRRGPAASCSTRRSCSAEDFHSAIAYLVRRLDENTAAGELPAPRLRPRAGLAGVGRASGAVPRRVRGRSTALSDAPAPHPGPRAPRTQRRPRRRRRSPDAPFVNEPDTDWSLAANRAWIERRRWPRWRDRAPESGAAPDRRRADRAAHEAERPRSARARLASRTATRWPIARWSSRALDAAARRPAGVGARGRSRARARSSTRARGARAAAAAI